jgi:ferritin-like metal-binding protein YciE
MGRRPLLVHSRSRGAARLLLFVNAVENLNTGAGMALETLRDVFRHHLGDAYHAEQQILAVLDAIELDTTTTELRDRVRAERAAVLRHIDSLERCFELLGTSPPRVESALAAALIAERHHVRSMEPSPAALEAWNTLALRRLTALRLETYRQLCQLADEVRQGDARRLLEQVLDAEYAFGTWLEEWSPRLLRMAAGSTPSMAQRTVSEVR